MGAAFLCDGMLGHYARWLRLMGLDTEFSGNEPRDDEILRRLRDSGRTLVTRDAELHHRARKQGSAAFLDTAADLVEGLAALLRVSGVRLDAGAFFTRCTYCNGRLAPSSARGPEVPDSVRQAGLPIVECPDCGHVYWEGTHVPEIRSRIAGIEARLSSLG